MSRIDTIRAKIQSLIREREAIINDYQSMIAFLQRKLVEELANEVHNRQLFKTLDAEGDTSISAGGPHSRFVK